MLWPSRFALALVAAMGIAGCGSQESQRCGASVHGIPLKAFLRAGDAQFRDALGHARSEASRCPGNPVLLPYLFYGALRTGESAEALAAYEAMAGGSEIPPDIHADAGLIYSERGEYHDAIASLSEAMSAEAAADLRLARAKAYVALGEYGPAVADLQAVVEQARAHRSDELAGFTSVGDNVYLAEAEDLLAQALEQAKGSGEAP